MKIILILLLLTTTAFAGDLRTPPPVKEPGLQDYLFNIRDNWNNLPVTTTDPDGTTPTLTATGLLSGASFTDNGDATGTLNWTPDFTQAGTYNVTFFAPMVRFRTLK